MRRLPETFEVLSYGEKSSSGWSALNWVALNDNLVVGSFLVNLIVPVSMGRITKRFFNGDGQNGESCLFIGSYKRRSERGK